MADKLLSEKDLQELKEYPLHFYQNGYKWNKQQINKLIEELEFWKQIAESCQCNN